MPPAKLPQLIKELSAGTLRTHGYPVTSSRFQVTGSDSQPVDLLSDTSLIICSQEWHVRGSHSTLFLDADSCFINCGSFAGGINWVYRDVICDSIDNNYTDSCHFRDVQCSSIRGNTNTFHNVTMGTG